MPLALPQVLALGLACAPQVAPSTIAAVAIAESGLDPLAIGVNGAGARPRPRTAEEATLAAHALIAAGRDIDLGLAQINVRNLPRLGLTVRDAFDPCLNLGGAGRILAEGYRRAGPRPGAEQAALRTALSFYNTGHPTRGLANGYVVRILAAAGTPAPPPPVDLPRRPSRPASFVITLAPGAGS